MGETTRAIAKLRASAGWHWLTLLFENLEAHHVSRAASAMAFDFFLGLVPLLALLGFVLAWLGQTSWLVMRAPLLETAPSAAAAMAKDQLVRLADPGALAPIGLVGFLWLASGGAHTAIATLEIISGGRRRSWLRTRALAALFVVGALATMSVATIAVVDLDLVTRGSVVRDLHDVLSPWLGIVVTVVATMLGVASLYRLTKGRDGPRHPVWPGAVLAVVCFAVLSLAFSTYVRTLGRYAAFYGGLAAVATLLIWLWLSSLALLVGAEVNALVGAEER